MALDGLFKRNGRWSLRIIIPKDVRAVYGKDQTVVALRTADRKAAVVRGTIERAQWLADFEQKRREQNLTLVEAVSPELGEMLAEMVRAQILATDDELREDQALWDDVAAATGARHCRLMISTNDRTAPRDSLGGLDSAEAELLADFNAILEGRAAMALAGRNLSSVLPLVQAQAKRLGLAFVPTALHRHDLGIARVAGHRWRILGLARNCLPKNTFKAGGGNVVEKMANEQA
ncbi:DUF6538 domain-containing protein [uncultured Ramlibacter sp.]|uniref:DUF6538 domain-containing protein n=1 Tax=uncultured Ramlibacter sp. TaxID=260755 RepID=UPI002639B44E|nr:DUF6538 domain-containing protein [uncultured Ramlibacter sp.]